jgi:hypothetical protein
LDPSGSCPLQQGCTFAQRTQQEKPRQMHRGQIREVEGVSREVLEVEVVGNEYIEKEEVFGFCEEIQRKAFLSEESPGKKVRLEVFAERERPLALRNERSP